MIIDDEDGDDHKR